jgi:hypothetical protein
MEQNRIERRSNDQEESWRGITALHENHPLESFSSLSLTEERSVCRTEPIRIDDIEAGAHLGITGEILDMEDGPEIMLLIGLSPLEGLRFILHLFGVNGYRHCKFLSF